LLYLIEDLVKHSAKSLLQSSSEVYLLLSNGTFCVMKGTTTVKKNYFCGHLNLI